MGFLDSVGDYVRAELPKKYAAMFSRATDEKLLEWWNEKQYDPEVDDVAKEVAEKELRRRHLI
jgi:hypothetical protein